MPFLRQSSGKAWHAQSLAAVHRQISVIPIPGLSPMKNLRLEIMDMKKWQESRNYRKIRDNSGNIIANMITADGVDVAVTDEVFEA